MFTPKCTFYSYNTRNGCREDATEAVATNVWDSDLKASVKAYHPRCKRHAAAEASKKYGAPERVAITDEMIATWADQKAKADRLAAEQRERTAERNAKAAEAYTAQLWDEDKVEYEHLRQDGKEFDWASRTEVPTPRWIVRPIGVTEEYREVAEVTIEQEAGRPDRVVIRNPSHLTPKAALHLAEAIKLAFGEAK